MKLCDGLTHAQCSFCEKQYKSAYKGYDVAWNCASFIKRWEKNELTDKYPIEFSQLKEGDLYISCGYESLYYSYSYLVNEDLERKCEEGEIICDTCIGNLEKKGDIKLIYRYY